MVLVATTEPQVTGSSNNIKPCPFCGNSILGFNENKTVYGKKWNFVDCPACGCRGPFGLTVQQGIDNWNSAQRSDKCQS